jgi:putative phage-type endonuclease
MATQSKAKWLKARNKGIGGTDASVVLGVSPYKTAFQLYQEKRGEIPPVAMNDAMRIGVALEPVVRGMYEEKTGRIVKVPGMMEMDGYPYILANLDGITNDGRVLEIKTAARSNGWGEQGSDEVPLHYGIQVQHYMMVTGLPVADLAVLIAGSDFRLYTIESDRSIHADILDASADFWNRVETGNPPPVVTYEDAIERYGRSNPLANAIQADDALIFDIINLKTISEDIKTLEVKEKEIKAQIFKALGDEYDTLVGLDGKPLATWKPSAGRKSFDAKTFEADHAELYQQYIKIGESSRRLLIK